MINTEGLSGDFSKQQNTSGETTDAIEEIKDNLIVVPILAPLPDGTTLRLNTISDPNDFSF